ncbi:MAG: adenylosuccinate lyase [Candidatus Thermoplasmatota archaeon]|jgi:adenylosuccinate lyase|nr:adenylosuccinate lyase [Candidatus Thermoplasmatota archaeon]
MIVSPLDYRYGREEARRIFTEEGRLQYMLTVESKIAEAESEIGLIPREDAEEIGKKSTTEFVKPERVKEIEKEIGHDVMAMVKALSEVSGESGRYVHLGATSNDINDTATALQLKDFYEILENDLFRLGEALAALATKYKETVMIGRTHGQHALPITFGLKNAVYLSEIMRHIDRLNDSRKRVLVGKFMGAVGTGAALGENSIKVQELVMNRLGIGSEEGPTQLVGRDRYIEYVSVLSSIATTLEKFATEIRNLQRPEIDEVQEPFDEEKQVGSSTMAQKMNPVVSENIASLARVIRGFITPMHESAILWHERDLTNSASERFIIPYTSILLDDILNKMAWVFENLKVRPEKMLQNLMSDDLILGEAYIMNLVGAGYSRQDAHEIVRKGSMEARRSGMKLKSVIEKSIGKPLEVLDPKSYIGNSVKITEDAVRSFKKRKRFKQS